MDNAEKREILQRVYDELLPSFQAAKTFRTLWLYPHKQPLKIVTEDDGTPVLVAQYGLGYSNKRAELRCTGDFYDASGQEPKLRLDNSQFDTTLGTKYKRYLYVGSSMNNPEGAVENIKFALGQHVQEHKRKFPARVLIAGLASAFAIGAASSLARANENASSQPETPEQRHLEL